MKRGKHTIPLLLGLGLILISLFLVLFFQIRLQIGASHSRHTVDRLTQMLPSRTVGVPESYPEPRMPVIELDGTDYVALLEIPAQGLLLPVADQWNNHRLSHAPARFTGSAYDGTLVIGGTDDPRQFGFCDRIDTGATVTITDMTGAQFTYTVSQVDRSGQAETQWLTQSDYDLTLFCRDQYTTDYLAVRCLSSYR